VYNVYDELDQRVSVNTLVEMLGICQVRLANQVRNGGKTWVEDLSVCRLRLAVLLTQVGRENDAILLAQQAREFSEQLVPAAFGSDPLVGDQLSQLLAQLRSVAMAYATVGDVLSARGETPEALSYYDAAHEVLCKLVKIQPRHIRHRLDRAAVLLRLSDSKRAMRDHDKAVTACEAALEDLELLRDNPRAAAIRARYLAQKKLGDLRLTNRQFDEARKWLTNALQLAEHLVEADPEVSQYQLDRWLAAVSMVLLSANQQGLGGKKPELSQLIAQGVEIQQKLPGEADLNNTLLQLQQIIAVQNSMIT
jgi:tetratricopeptide (TPR) repeat protein